MAKEHALLGAKEEDNLNWCFHEEWKDAYFSTPVLLLGIDEEDEPVGGDGEDRNVGTGTEKEKEPVLLLGKFARSTETSTLAPRRMSIAVTMQQGRRSAEQPVICEQLLYFSHFLSFLTRRTLKSSAVCCNRAQLCGNVSGGKTRYVS